MEYPDPGSEGRAGGTCECPSGDKAQGWPGAGTARGSDPGQGKEGQQHPPISALGWIKHPQHPADGDWDGDWGRCAALTQPSIILALPKGPCHHSQPCPTPGSGCGVPRVPGKGAGPSLLGQSLGWSEGLGVETSIVFPPVRVTKGQMDFHEMLLKNEKGLASGPRPRVPNPPQAEFYD